MPDNAQRSSQTICKYIGNLNDGKIDFLVFKILGRGDGGQSIRKVPSLVGYRVSSLVRWRGKECAKFSEVAWVPAPNGGRDARKARTVHGVRHNESVEFSEVVWWW